MILVDRPEWPAHGTTFAHMVSDADLAELHRFADRIGLSARAFDRDHYDLPAERYADALAAGARVVDPRTLVRAVRRAGLRRPKPAALAARNVREDRLRTAWAELVPGAAGLGADLLGRWSEPARRYHTTEHLAEVLAALDRLATDGVAAATTRPVRLAAWFHDAVYRGRPGDDEEESAELAERTLDGLLPAGTVGEVGRLVRLTAGHRVEDGDDFGAALADADLAILAAGPDRYLAYTRQVRAEYHTVPEPVFRRGRRAVLGQLQALDPLYRTPPARRDWTRPARANLAAERAALAGPVGEDLSSSSDDDIARGRSPGAAPVDLR